jgi:VanZ family protein
MNRPPAWLAEGRPVLGAALLSVFALSVALLLYEGTRPPTDVGLPRVAGLDKLLHLAAHFWTSTLLYWGLMLTGRPPDPRRRLIGAATIVLGIDLTAGVAIEYMQLFVGSDHGRVFDGKDIGANALGTVAALLLAVTVSGRLMRR